MNRSSTIAALAILAVATPAVAAAQSDRFEVAIHLASAHSSQFDATDLGIGGRFAWRPSQWLGAEAEMTYYPGDFPNPGSFSRARAESLFGVTVGPTLERVRPFVRVRSGFLRFRGPSEPIACILIFPPPLACVLASGRTLFALDLGGGVELFVTRKTFVRVDAGDRLLRYPGPAFDARRSARENAFLSHDFRFAAGGGVRF